MTPPISATRPRHDTPADPLLPARGDLRAGGGRDTTRAHVRGRAEDRLFAAIERDARVLAGLLHERIETGDTRAAARIAEDYTSHSSARVVVTDATGLSVVDTSEPGAAPRDFSTRPEFVSALEGTQDMGIRYSETLGEELAVVAVPIMSNEAVSGAVRVSFTTEVMREQVRDNWLRLGALAALVLVAAASFGWLMARWAMSPVESLETGAGASQRATCRDEPRWTVAHRSCATWPRRSTSWQLAWRPWSIHRRRSWPMRRTSSAPRSPHFGFASIRSRTPWRPTP
ncbi:MAG: hypothetical protein M5U19_18755 [Microthrixaceae bacterium]|nr:hypothetical protein [Microthrixaceae bacterium]